MINSQPSSDLTPEPCMPRPRTAAQQEASRRNGAKSHGPLRQRKQTSEPINLPVFLVAKNLLPQRDTRGEDLDYLRILRSLQEEFPPQTPTAAYTLEMLASDYLMLRRLIEERENLLAMWYHMQAQRDQLPNRANKIADLAKLQLICWRLMSFLERNHDMLEPGSSAAELATFINSFLQETHDSIKAQDDPDVPHTPMEWLTERLQEMRCDVIKDFGVDRLTAVFTGNEPIPTELRAVWYHMLRFVLNHLWHLVTVYNEEQTCRNRMMLQPEVIPSGQQEQHVALLDSLIQQEGYYRQSIERTLKRLRKIP